MINSVDFLLTLKNRCIQKESESRCEALIKDYFRKNVSEHEKEIMEQKLSALKFFLETVDFPRLRAAFPELAPSGESPGVQVGLTISQSVNEVKLHLNGQTIRPMKKLNANAKGRHES